MRGEAGSDSAEMTNATGTLHALQALAEPNRLKIAELLRAGPQSVGEIAQKLGLRQPQASKHLKVLTEAGVSEVRPEANKRIYALRQEPFTSLDAWIGTFTRTMEERYDKLETYLGGLMNEEEAGD